MRALWRGVKPGPHVAPVPVRVLPPGQRNRSRSMDQHLPAHPHRYLLARLREPRIRREQDAGLDSAGSEWSAVRATNEHRQDN